MNELENFFKENKDKPITKWSNYFEIYEQHFARFRNKKIHILEIGVFGGGSLDMWKNYFAPGSIIVGVDIDSTCKSYESKNVRVEIGSQEDPVFLCSLKNKYPCFDIIIDDGGHSMVQQKTSFNYLFEHLTDHGVYLVEDTFTSFWLAYGGSGTYGKKKTFLEFSKNLIDRLYTYHVIDGSIQKDYFAENLYSIHFYDGIVVFEKRKKVESLSLRSGNSNLFSKKIRQGEEDYSHFPPFIENASFLRICWWRCKVVAYLLMLKSEKRDTYREQLRLWNISRTRKIKNKIL